LTWLIVADGDMTGKTCHGAVRLAGRIRKTGPRRCKLLKWHYGADSGRGGLGKHVCGVPKTVRFLSYLQYAATICRIASGSATAYRDAVSSGSGGRGRAQRLWGPSGSALMCSQNPVRYAATGNLPKTPFQGSSLGDGQDVYLLSEPAR
jgi:hypothetical protein